MFLKRGQGVPLKAVIVGALVLIVLIVTVSFFTTRTSKFSKNVNECESKGGFCARHCSEFFATASLDCPADVIACCLLVGDASKSEIVDGDNFK